MKIFVELGELGMEKMQCKIFSKREDNTIGNNLEEEMN